MSKEELQTGEYPFRSHYHAFDEGWMHYLDEGNGDPLLFIHGNPEWSFSFRRPILRLRRGYRCIAPDHLGFGLSDKPTDPELLTPRAHARRLWTLLDALELDRMTLVMNDWGGPIGMSIALEMPERIKALVILNSWLWPLDRSILLQVYSRVMGNKVLGWPFRKWKLLIRWGMPLGFAKPSRFTPELRKHYEYPFRDPASREGQRVFARHILASSSWSQDLWERRERLEGVPMLLAKGQRDRLFTRHTLRKWRQAFPKLKIDELSDAGHFPQEELGDRVGERIEAFLKTFDKDR